MDPTTALDVLVTAPSEDGRPDAAGHLVQALAEEVARTAERLDEAGVEVHPPQAHPTSLALCVLGAVWAPRVAATTTAAVVDRFRDDHGDRAGAPELVAAVVALGGDQAWASSRATSHRVWSHPGAPLKATAARLGAQALADAGVGSPAQLLALLDAVRADDPDGVRRRRWDALRRAWCSVPGQRSGRSWHRLLLLAGAERVVPDDDVRRFVARWVRGLVAGAAGDTRPARRPDAGVAADLLEKAAQVTGSSPRVVDHVVWRSELQRGTAAGRRRQDGPSSDASGPP